MLSVRCLSCPVCNVRALWPNGWTDQDETWHAGRPRPWPLCVRWEPSSPPPKWGRSPLPQFSARICCSQMAGWIKMPLGMEVGLSPWDFVFIIVNVISLEHCTKHSRYWFIQVQVQVLYSVHYSCSLFQLNTLCTVVPHSADSGSRSCEFCNAAKRR